MLQRINMLIENSKQEEKEIRKAQYAALQAQINPHFYTIPWISLHGRYG